MFATDVGKGLCQNLTIFFILSPLRPATYDTNVAGSSELSQDDKCDERPE